MWPGLYLHAMGASIVAFVQMGDHSVSLVAQAFGLPPLLLVLETFFGFGQMPPCGRGVDYQSVTAVAHVRCLWEEEFSGGGVEIVHHAEARRKRSKEGE